MPSRLLADEDVPVQVVRWLIKKGHDVLTVKAISIKKSGDGIHDEQVLAYAAQHGRAVLTQNVGDFKALHALSPGHKGIIASRVFEDWKGFTGQIVLP